jgi:hypothetical protein
MIRRALLLALVLTTVTAPAAHAIGGVGYLASRQSLSGGFSERGAPVSVSLTEWAVMGLRAAGQSPAGMHRAGGHTAASFLARRAPRWHSAFALERGILGVVAMGKDPRSFGGRNLVRALRSQITRSGRIGPFANSTYWGVLALRAARSTVPARSISYIRGAAGASGGFGYAAGSGPDSNDTAAAVMALRAGRVPCDWRVMTNAYAYMHTLQRSDHGYALTSSAGSDSQSTSWVVQARIKCRLSNRRALGYLAARHRTNGSYAYSASSNQTPAWVTAQVLPAVHGKAYPIR